MSPELPRERELWLSRHLFWAVSVREAALSIGRNTADSSVNLLQNSVSKHLSLTDCLDF